MGSANSEKQTRNQAKPETAPKAKSKEVVVDLEIGLQQQRETKEKPNKKP